jgi:hypothetical protein
VPLMVAEGYAASYGVGQYLTHVQRGIVTLERALIAGGLLLVLAALGWYFWHQRRAKQRRADGLSRRASGSEGPEIRHAGPASDEALLRGYPAPPTPRFDAEGM